jgi:hypothetical protein
MPLCDQCGAALAADPLAREPRADARAGTVMGRRVGPVAWHLFDLLYRARGSYVPIERLVGLIYGGRQKAEPQDPANVVKVLVCRLRREVLPGSGLTIESTKFGPSGGGAYCLVDAGAPAAVPAPLPIRRRGSGASDAYLDRVIDTYLARPDLTSLQIAAMWRISQTTLHAAIRRREAATGEAIWRRPARVRPGKPPEAMR